jgi:hypothetical protein
VDTPYVAWRRCWLLGEGCDDAIGMPVTSLT